MKPNGMGILLTLFCLLLSSLAVGALFRQLQRRHAHTGLWVTFCILVACGVAIGIWCAFFYEDQRGPRTRITGFPFSISFSRLEGRKWVDIRTPGIQAWLTAFANIVTIVALTTLPLWLAARKFRLWQFLCMGCTLGVGLGMLGERIAMPAALFIVGSLLISLLMDILAAVLRRQPKK